MKDKKNPTNLGMLIDGAILDAILTFDSVEKSEKACIRSVEKMFDLLEAKKNRFVFLPGNDGK